MLAVIRLLLVDWAAYGSFSSPGGSSPGFSLMDDEDMNARVIATAWLGVRSLRDVAGGKAGAGGGFAGGGGGLRGLTFLGDGTSATGGGTLELEALGRDAAVDTRVRDAAVDTRVRARLRPWLRPWLVGRSRDGSL